jgi:hypothetical protein
VSKRTAVVAVLALAATVLAGPAAGFAQPPATSDTAPAVQLNADTAVAKGLVDKYVFDDFNVAIGFCPAPGTDRAPRSTTFSSPVLTFGGYAFGPTLGVHGNVTADATLKSGTQPGRYPLTMTCNGTEYTATFTVGGQVRTVPRGAARAGGGGTAG